MAAGPCPMRARTLTVVMALLCALPTLARANDSPVTLYADQIHGIGSGHWTATGHVEVLYGNRKLYADSAHYDQNSDEIIAQGHVHLVSPGLVTNAPKAKLKVRANQGIVFAPRYVLPSQDGHGHALQGQELGKGRYRLNEACYTTCHGRIPAWQLWSQQLDLNQNDQYIATRNTTLDVFGLPVLWLPYLNFPLARHSGFLPPTLGSSTINGLTLGVPYYFDIASNLDDTLTVEGLSKRGVLLQNQFRYLEPRYSGTLLLDLLPNDKLTDSTVWAISWQHQQNLGDGLQLNVNLNRVSYRNFLADLAGVTQFNGGYLGGVGNAPYLTSTATISYGSNNLNAGVALQDYQELAQGGSAPYAQLPYVYANGYWRLADSGYFDWRSNFNYFYASTGPIGQRLDLTPTLGWKWSRAWGFLEPQARLYYSHYQIQRNGPSYARSINRSLPALSLKGGLNFVRFGSDGSSIVLQPLFKYLYIPLQAQNQIPLFDTSQPFQNFPSIFTDNSRYDGSDRINAANQLAYGFQGTGYTASSRQLWSAAIGQIQYFNSKQINLAGDIVSQNARSNYFWQAQYAPLPTLNLLASSETNADWKHLERMDFRAQWLAPHGTVLNLDYRYTHLFVHQTGVSAAVPIGRQWRLLGSYQYDLQNDKPLEQLLGIGYDGGCWTAQFVVFHQILLGGQTNNAVYLEIVLRGLTSIGNSRGFLDQYVPGASMEF